MFAYTQFKIAEFGLERRNIAGRCDWGNRTSRSQFEGVKSAWRRSASTAIQRYKRTLRSPKKMPSVGNPQHPSCVLVEEHRRGQGCLDAKCDWECSVRTAAV